jgi:hypothetical protein
MPKTRQTMNLDPELHDERLKNISLTIGGLQSDTIEIARRTHVLLIIIAVLLGICAFKLLTA